MFRSERVIEGEATVASGIERAESVEAEPQTFRAVASLMDSWGEDRKLTHQYHPDHDLP